MHARSAARTLIDADVHAVVAALRSAIVALAERVAVLERRPRGRVDDDVELMAAIASRVGGAVFSARELLAHATVDRELRAALRRHGTVQQVGLRLRAIADRPLAGFVLCRVARDEHGILWGLQVAPHLHPGPCPRGDRD